MGNRRGPDSRYGWSSYENRTPADPLKDRKERFRQVNDFVTAKGGWITSIPGDFEVMVECTQTSTLPDELTAAGWKLRDEGEGERLIPGTIVERFVLGAGGELVPMTEGSTKPVALEQRHTGIVKTRRYSFPIG